jgi:dTDP-4-amino-4,6-dideoxygalactose transaminase
MIPISGADVRDAAPVVVEVCRSGPLLPGSAVARLEAGFAELTGAPHAVAVPSGTAALVAALRALDIGPGDEVVTSPFTSVATLSAILAAGATARFADVSAADCCVDPAAVAAAIGPRTRALLPVHLYGRPADLGRLAPLAARHGVALVEDAAQAMGATFEGRPVGSIGVGCFSLHATLHPRTGVGGMVTTADDRLARRLRGLAVRGHDDQQAGHAHRTSDPPAIGIPQLARLAERIGARARNAERLTEGLAGLPGLVVPTALPGRGHAWHQYTVRVTGQARLSRDELSERLAELGVASGVHYRRLAFDHCRDHPRVVVADMPVAAALTREVLSLPVHPALSDADVASIVDAVRVALTA